ncbi:MAG: zf-TFIIB domain-containing protein [Candidatus Tectomicrobia bacterium]|nr:zf-TFIIB domain-containing protein [Candidatus Tectomicrobia bacterium]
MDGRGKFDTYTEFLQNLEHGRENAYFAQKDRELIAKLREKDQEELERAIFELCSMRCPKCGQKLEETIYNRVRIDRCIGCGGVWLDPGELETLAREEQKGWIGELLELMAGGRKEGSVRDPGEAGVSQEKEIPEERSNS